MFKNHLNKKGFVQVLAMLPQIAIIFVVSTIIFALGIVILVNFQSNGAIYVATSTSITNESFTAPLSNATLNGTVSLANRNLTSFTSIVNGTAFTLGSGNYSVNTNTGVVTFISNNSVCPTGTTCYATYVYNSYNSTAASVAISKGIAATAEIPNNWLLLFAIVVAAGMLVTVTVYALWRGGLGGFAGGGGNGRM